MSLPVVLIGAGGHGRELLDIIEAQNAHGASIEVVGFLSDYPVNEARVHRRGFEVLGGIDLLAELDADYVIAVGDGIARQAIDAHLQSMGRSMRSLVHPAATRSASASTGPGLVMAAGARIGPGAQVGCRVHLNTNATIGTDAVVGDDVTVSPGGFIGERAVVGEAVFVGAGGLITEGSSVGPRCMIGGGAVATGDIPADSTIVGSTARVRRP